MNKKSILAIIGLMTCALAGIVLVQAYWVRSAVALNEEQFDKSVQEAMYAVTQQLETQELVAAFELIKRRTPNLPVPEIDTSFQLQKSSDGNMKMEMQISVPFASLLINQPIAAFSAIRSPHQKQEQMQERFYAFSKMMGRHVFSPQVLTHITNKSIKSLLDNELHNRGIKLPCDFGLYSVYYGSVVSSYYADCPEDSTYLKREGYKSLFASPYKLPLFIDTYSNEPGGFLMLYFPDKNIFVWKKVWLNLLGSLLFAAIILFCFIYTIQVIFKQKQLSDVKNDFINNMTHEFKTPIATISLAADSISNPMIAANPDRVRRFANIIKEENKRMNKQVEKVLQMALLDKEEVKMNYKEIDIHTVIETAVQNIGLQIEKREGTLVETLSATNPIIVADEVHLTNVIYNLLDNANKYSAEKPSITIHTEDAQNGVRITVADKGIGMAKEDTKKIFDKFYRVGTGNLHDVKGFGLGLSYVKKIVDAHRGTVQVKSELHKGSEFILYFPSQHESNTNSMPE